MNSHSQRTLISWGLQILLLAIAAVAVLLYVKDGRADQMRKDRQEFFNLLSESLDRVDVGYWQWEFDKEEVFWAPGLYAIYGIEQGTPMSYDKWLQTLLPEDRAQADKICRECAETGEPYVMVYHIKTPDGEIRKIQESGASHSGHRIMVGVCVWIRDDGPVGVECDMGDHGNHASSGG